jgi:signal transduction histidine kinase
MSSTTPLVAVEGTVAVVFLLLATLGVRHRDRPGAVPATLLWLALAGVAAGLALGRADVIGGRTAVSVVLVGWTAAVPLWAGFAFEHTGRGPSVNRRWTALAVVYVTATGVASLRGAAFGGAVGQFVRVGTSVLQTALIGVGLFGVFLLVRSAVSYDDLPRGQGLLLAVSGIGISLLLFSVSTLTAADPTRLPWAITGFLVVIAGTFTVGAIPYRLFDEAPGGGPLARSSVLGEMREAVVVVDRKDRLVDANAAAEQSLGVVVARDAGRQISSVLGWDPDTLLEEVTTVTTPNGRRQLEASRSRLTNSSDEPIGTAFVFQDVTDRRTRQQRLEVLDRVLRHNLRNDLDAIRGFAEELSEEDVDEPAEFARRIRSTANDLVDIGTTIERADTVIAQDTLDPREVDVEVLVTDVADAVGDQHDCRIQITTNDGETRLTTDRDVLHMALREVVENAVEHTDRGEPTVTIEVESTAGSVTVAVRDHGPGIPDHERAVLLEGHETPLQHGTGVGLWFVSWAVTRLGGSLSFDDVESGSRVIIEVPDRTVQ